MAWVDLTVFAGNPTKAIEANTIQANITAQANGDPGAPKNTLASMAANSVGFSQMTDNSIGQAEMRDSAIGQSELRTSLGSGFSVDSGLYIFPGGQYGFYPNFGSTVVTPGELSATMFRGSGDQDDSKNAYYFHFEPVGNISLLWDQRYITASPPYNLGDGDCSLFTFLKLAANGDILGAYIADAPPWAYNGPTDIRPDEVVTKNKKVRKYKNVLVSKPTPPWEGGDIDLWEKGPVYKKREIDHDLKNADMSLIPHPFGPLKPGERVVMVDPCGRISDTLHGMQSLGEDVTSLFREKYIILGDEIDCNNPDGVIVVSADWKRSK